MRHLKLEIIPIKILCKVVRDSYGEYIKEELIEIDIDTNPILAGHVAGEIIHMSTPIPKTQESPCSE